MRELMAVTAMYLALTALSAAAQDQPGDAPLEPGAPAGDPTGEELPPSPEPKDTAVPEVTPPKELTTEQQIAAGEAIVKNGTRLSQRIGRMLSEARRANDIIKTTCLNDKLSQVNANLGSAQQRLTALKEAVNPDRRNHEYTVLTVLGQKLDVLDQEASQCVGEDLYQTGATKVETQVDTAIVPQDETPSMPPVVLPPALPTVPTSPSPTT